MKTYIRIVYKDYVNIYHAKNVIYKDDTLYFNDLDDNQIVIHLKNNRLRHVMFEFEED